MITKFLKAKPLTLEVILTTTTSLTGSVSISLIYNMLDLEADLAQLKAEHKLDETEDMERSIPVALDEITEGSGYESEEESKDEEPESNNYGNAK